MNNELRGFLLELRQHPLFPQLIAGIEQPRLPEYRPSKGETLEIFGAKSAFASGQLDQFRQWHLLLTGQVPARETNPSETGETT